MLSDYRDTLLSSPEYAYIYKIIDGYSEDVDSSSSSGTSLFVGLGYSFDFIEIFMNYRINTVEHKFDMGKFEETLGMDLGDSDYDVIAGSYSIYNFGLGFVF